MRRYAAKTEKHETQFKKWNVSLLKVKLSAKFRKKQVCQKSMLAVGKSAQILKGKYKYFFFILLVFLYIYIFYFDVLWCIHVNTFENPRLVARPWP